MMGERGWQKLPYPKFLENVLGSLWGGGMKLWCGKCIFSLRGKVRVQTDSRHQDVTAVATMSADLTGLMDEVHQADAEFRAVVKAGGVDAVRRFDVVEAVPAHNPDGSFHHMALRLREREGDWDDALCEESGGVKEDFGGGAGGAGADCP
ncbi:MAG: hypothetical protein LBE55_03315 [Clostridiales bacterium]|jgi:hypothetical protein|nr:hypothetical protein [Clostridiales bacterium]